MSILHTARDQVNIYAIVRCPMMHITERILNNEQ